MDARAQTAPAGQRRSKKNSTSRLAKTYGFSSTADLVELSELPNRRMSGDSIKIVDTRFGRKRGKNIYMPSEERFTWQKPSYLSDSMYNLPSAMDKKNATKFGSSTREDWKCLTTNKKDSVNPYTGPGRYRTLDERQALSSAPNLKNVRFGSGRREFGDLKTPSPGPAYHYDGVYRYGKDKKLAPGFNKDDRPPLNADLIRSNCQASYMPRLPSGGPRVVFGKDEGFRERGGGGDAARRSPGPIYDTSRHDFRTGPSFSFGASKAKRFS